MKKIKLFVGVGLLLGSAQAQAYPLLSTFAESSNGRVLFYQDHTNASKYWYFSNVIDPVENLDGSVSIPVVRPHSLYFAYSGQAQVRKSDLVEFAESKGIKLTDLAPMPFQKTELTGCFGTDAAKLSIQIPPRVGSFLEHLPVTVSSRDPETVDVVAEALKNGSGVNCFASVLYKVAADVHSIKYEVAMNDVFNQLEVGTYARYWIWEADLKTNLKNYARNGLIKVTEFKDGDYNQPQVLDPKDGKQSTEDMFMTVFDLVIKQLLNRVTKIPQDAGLPAPGKGALFSLRANYVRSTEQFGFHGEYKLQGTRDHESLIQIRVAPKKQ